MFLVTNWHNLSGRSPLTGELISRSGAVPDRVFFHAYKQTSEADERGFFQLAYVPVEVTLCAPDLTGPQWLEHPRFGPKVDVAAIDVTSAVIGLNVEPANVLESDAILEPTASQDVFVIGFPFGLLANAFAPVWKRGSIALDPTLNPEGLPKVFIDTATREGMSGSLVLARHIVVGREFSRKDGTISDKILYGAFHVVLGVYSGRHYPDLERAQLGVVWKRSAIDETVCGGRSPGNWLPTK